MDLFVDLVVYFQSHIYYLNFPNITIRFPAASL